MEEHPASSESEGSPSSDFPAPRASCANLSTRTLHRLLGVFALLSICTPQAKADALANIQSSGKLSYGSDKEGGGPYAYPNPKAPREVIGFEVELMEELAKTLNAKAEFSQGPWDRLLKVLDTGSVDVVTNGYEWTETRSREYQVTRPYYVYQLQLMVDRSSPLQSWDDVRKPKPNGRRWRVGVLVSSAAFIFAQESGGSSVEVVPFDGSTDAMNAVGSGQIDATLQDLPAAIFYRDRFPNLKFAGKPEGHGYYVIFLRQEDRSLRDALDKGLESLIQSGKLRTIYERYGVWNEAQGELATWNPGQFVAKGEAAARGWRLIWQYRPLLIDATLMTILLSLSSMPLAMVLGLFVALGRLYGPKPVQWLMSLYVEILRGTPLMLQLFVLFYLLELPALVAGIAGLAINYSAYEAEIYRAGIQAIPAGQMEAALALGMSRSMALRRVIVPQAVRIVIPAVTNDFIALFKDTSVCSAITLVELTKQYSILGNSTGRWIDFAVITAFLYMTMSIPLSWLSRYSESRLDAIGAKGGVPA